MIGARIWVLMQHCAHIFALVGAFACWSVKLTLIKSGNHTSDMSLTPPLLPLQFAPQMDKWTDGRTFPYRDIDSRTHLKTQGQMDRWTNWWTDRPSRRDSRMHLETSIFEIFKRSVIQVDGRTHKWTDWMTDGWTKWQTDKPSDRWMAARTIEQTEGRAGTLI